MEKRKLGDLKNPVTSREVNIFNPADWLGSILYVAWFGLIAVLGIKALEKADAVLPGNQTPASYKAAVTEKVTDTVTVL